MPGISLSSPRHSRDMHGSRTSSSDSAGLIPFVAWVNAFLILLFLPRCAIISPVPVTKPLSERRTMEVVSRIRDQDRRVSCFYTRGILSTKNWYGGSEADILIVGIRDPQRFKIEITHPWGRPLLHILIDRKRLEVLSFEEKRRYLGIPTPETLSRFLPGNLNVDLIWPTLRGYPNLLGHQRVTSGRANQITLINDKGEAVEIIGLSDDDLVPNEVYFPDQGIRLIFSKYQSIDGIRYAGEVKVVQVREKKSLTLTHKRMVFNRSVPEEIFSMDAPPTFETFWLN